MKKIVIYLLISSAIFMTGCLKDTPNVDFSSSGVIAELSNASITGNNAPSSGLSYFGAATLPVFSSLAPDTVTFDVNIASDYPPTSDVSVTVAVDDAKRVAYNATSSVIFDPQPDSTFSLPVTTMVIKAGFRLAKFIVIFYPAKIDPTKTYMLPISLTDASGITISGNLATIYFHVIGNLLAGSYTQEWIRYNTAGMTGTPAFDEDVSPGIFVPVSPTEISVSSGTGPNYYLSFTNNNPPGGNDLSLLTDFVLTMNPVEVASFGITLNAGPVLVLADPVNHTFTFNFGYLNGSGAPRNITDKFTP
jgi:Domain of unknown function (DUF1735)